MWTRRVLFATMVAAAAMSLPKHAGSGDGSASALQGLVMTAQK